MQSQIKNIHFENNVLTTKKRFNDVYRLSIFGASSILSVKQVLSKSIGPYFKFDSMYVFLKMFQAYLFWGTHVKPPDDGDDAPDPEHLDTPPKKMKLKKDIIKISDELRLVRDFILASTPALARVAFPAPVGTDDAPVPVKVLSTATKIITIPTYVIAEHDNKPMVWTVQTRAIWRLIPRFDML